MAKRRNEQPRCHWCHQFISWKQANRSFKWIQNPYTFDPDPYEIFECEADYTKD